MSSCSSRVARGRGGRSQRRQVGIFALTPSPLPGQGGWVASAVPSSFRRLVRTCAARPANMRTSSELQHADPRWHSARPRFRGAVLQVKPASLRNGLPRRPAAQFRRGGAKISQAPPSWICQIRHWARKARLSGHPCRNCLSVVPGVPDPERWRGGRPKCHHAARRNVSPHEPFLPRPLSVFPPGPGNPGGEPASPYAIVPCARIRRSGGTPPPAGP